MNLDIDESESHHLSTGVDAIDDVHWAREILPNPHSAIENDEVVSWSVAILIQGLDDTPEQHCAYQDAGFAVASAGRLTIVLFGKWP
jgi:hypothetical protein